MMNSLIEERLVLDEVNKGDKQILIEYLNRACVEKGIFVKVIDYPLKICITFFADMSIVIVAKNCNEVHLIRMIEFITQQWVMKN